MENIERGKFSDIIVIMSRLYYKISQISFGLLLYVSSLLQKTKLLIFRSTADTYVVKTILLHVRHIFTCIHIIMRERAFVLNFIQDEESYHPNFSSECFSVKDMWY